MRKKLLVLTPRFPFPAVGGDRVRIRQVCKQLSSVYDLSLLSLCSDREEMIAPADPEGVFGAVHRVYHPLWKRACGVLGALASRTPLQVGYYRNSEFSRRLQELMPDHDGILAHLIRTGDYIRDLSVPKFLEMTDAISLSYARAKRVSTSNLVRSLAYRIDAPRLDRYEREAIRSFDVVVLVSPIDRDYLAGGECAENILVCPIGIDLASFPFSFSPDGRTIVFIGNMTSHQNLDAAEYFASEVLPVIRERIPRAEFRVAGRTDPRARRVLLRYPAVVVTGAVEAIAGAVRGASVGVCPVRFGAGMQSKLLEYMAMGIPAVTSPIGLEGLCATPDRHVLIADDRQQWASKVCGLLENREAGFQMARDARSLVEQHYSWSETIGPLRAAIEARLERRRTAA